MCFSPNGDFFDALNNGKADVATGKIETMTSDSIILESGQQIKADVIVTATGLKVMLVGGTKITVDGVPLNPADKFAWKGVMLQDMPNAAYVIGYADASWTLGADATAQMVCRLLNNMKKAGYTSFVPRHDENEEMKQQPVLNLNSTYIERAKDVMPKAGDRGQWKPRKTYLRDMWEAKFGDVTSGLEFSKVST